MARSLTSRGVRVVIVSLVPRPPNCKACIANYESSHAHVRRVAALARLPLVTAVYDPATWSDDLKHLNPAGHAIVTEAVIAAFDGQRHPALQLAEDIAEAGGSSSSRGAAVQLPQAVQVPSVHRDGWGFDAGSHLPTCVFGAELPPLILPGSAGFDFTTTVGGYKDKPGLVATAPKASLRLCLRGLPPAFGVSIAFERSDVMGSGNVSLGCEGGCSCPDELLTNGEWTLRYSGKGKRRATENHMHRVFGFRRGQANDGAGMAGGCDCVLTMRNTRDEAESLARVKLNGLVAGGAGAIGWANNWHMMSLALRPVPPSLDGLDVVTGWWRDGAAATVDAMQSRLAARQHLQRLKPWNLWQVYKYEWLLRELVLRRNASRDLGARDEHGQSTPPLWLLADTDTLFMCGARELHRRFRSFGSELVISVEKQRRGVHRELPSDGEGSQADTTVYWEPMRKPRNPNSGLVMGTFKGALQLLSALSSLRNAGGAFPCCPLMHTNGTLARDRCAADDQICLIAALRASSRVVSRAPSDEFDFRLDENATLFATLSAWQDVSKGLRYWDEPSPGGGGKTRRVLGYRIKDDPRYTATPCIAHFAGAGKVALSRILHEPGRMQGPHTWLPSAAMDDAKLERLDRMYVAKPARGRGGVGREAA